MHPDLQSKLEFIMGRRSTRTYAPGAVSDEIVQALLAAAMAAPSAAARDPWRFVVIRSASGRKAIADVLPNGQMVREAAVALVVCGDLDIAHDRQISYLLQDCTAAIENLLLAAHALGLGSCWMGIHPREDRLRRISQLLKLPAHIIPVSAISLGLPGEKKDPRTRFAPEYVRIETWQ